MEFLIVENGIIINTIISDEIFARKIGALPYYKGALIGHEYNPPTPEPTQEQDTMAMLVDQEYRLTLLEMGV